MANIAIGAVMIMLAGARTASTTLAVALRAFLPFGGS